MDKILVIAFTEADGSAGKAAREAITAAKSLAGSLGAEWALGLVGKTVQPAADALAGCGAAAIHGVAGEAFAQPRYSTDAAASTALARAAEATLILAPATARASRIAAGVAQRLGGKFDAQATELTAEGGAPAITRWFYRQRIRAVMSREQRPWVVTLATGVFAPCEDEAGSASVEAVAVDAPATRTQVTGIQAPAGDAQTIRPEAELLFVAGAGWTKKQSDGEAHIPDAEKLILAFLKGSQASLGSSKSLVDLSGEGQAVLPFMTHMNQIGQTGATPRHPKGLATCCHGEEPHVVGWRFISERRAINMDANCGWAQGKADVLYVADAFEVVKELNALLGA